MPIRRRAEKDLEHLPGQLRYNFEKPLQGLVEDYTAESHQDSLRDVFRRGWDRGYQQGYKDAQSGLKSFVHLDPNSEEAR